MDFSACLWHDEPMNTNTTTKTAHERAVVYGTRLLHDLVEQGREQWRAEEGWTEQEAADARLDSTLTGAYHNVRQGMAMIVAALDGFAISGHKEQMLRGLLDEVHAILNGEDVPE